MKSQRTSFYHDSGVDFTTPWRRPLPEKWSLGETFFHLLLMERLFRRFSYIYLPIMLPFAHLRKKKPYKTEIHNPYQDFQKKRKRPMKAPFLIVPPSRLEEKFTFEDIQALLEAETDKLKVQLRDMEEEVAGQIRYPDPVVDYPNLIQCIHLLAIHEQHHFNVTKKYLI
nr:DinB family protein [Bacillus piscicola]